MKSPKRKINKRSEIIGEQPENEEKNNEQPASQPSKKDALQEKKIAKFDKTINKAVKHILNHSNSQAIEIMNEIMLEGQYLDRYQFKGLGNFENWRYYYPKGPYQWFTQTYKQNQSYFNPFDLLSIIFMLEQHDKNIKMETIYTHYEQFLDKLPQRHQIFIGLGNAYYNSTQSLKAEEYYLRALELKQSESVYEYLAWVKGIQFDLDEIAVEYCEKCLEINPENRGALYVKAVCHPNANQIQGILNKLSQKFPSYYRIYYSLAYYTDTRQEAKKLCDKALSYDPQYLTCYFYKARLLKKQSSESKQMYEKAFDIFEANQNFWYWYGNHYGNGENYKDAIYVLEKTIQINPYHKQTLKALAMCYNEVDDKQMSQFYYVKYLELHPYDCEAYNYLGLIYDDNQERVKAMECYNKALNVNPKFFDCLLNLGHSYQINEDYAQAADLYNRAYDVRSSPDISYGLAICYYYLDNFVNAEHWGLRCIELGGDQEQQIYQFMGDIYCSDGQHLQAMQWYLKNACVSEQLHTQYIMENMIENMDKKQVWNVLKECAEVPEDDEKMFWFLQLGRLYLELKNIEGARVCYEIVKKMNEQDIRDWPIVNEELRKFYGCPEQGYFCILDEKKLLTLKAQYYSTFDKLYNTTDSKVNE